MSTTFQQLNEDWNAEPNDPNPQAEWTGEDLKLSFRMNPWQFPQFREGDVGEITFSGCARYRFGKINDEGWYRGQCRFKRLAPRWGEFYIVSGDLKLDQIPDDWNTREQLGHELNHYLFYFRDNEFECDAISWKFTVRNAEPGHAP